MMSVDDDLDRVLQRAFDDARPTGHEDVRGLREGAVAKAHGMRRRRRLGTAAVSAVATTALVAGVGSLAAGGWLGVGAGSTVGSPAGQANSAPVGGEPAAPVTSYVLGDFFPDEASLPKGVSYAEAAMERTGTEGARGAAVSGVQICDGIRVADTTGMDDAPGPVSHAYRLALATDNAKGASSVLVTVSGWARGTGAQRFADLQNNTMGCRFGIGYERLTWPGRDTDATWLSAQGKGDSASHVAAQRVGDVIVAVVVDMPGNGPSAQQNAIRLSDEIVAKLRASNLAAAKGR